MMHDGTNTRRGGPLLAVMMLLATMVMPLSPVADARGTAGTGYMSEASWEEGAGGPADEVDRWWGVVGAAVCGGEIRLILRAPAIGMNPYVLAAGIAGCSLAALDILTTK